MLEDVWEDLGRALSIDDKTLQSINQKFTTPIKKQKELFRTYLRNCLHPTWDDIIRALLKIGKLHIAENVVETLQLPQELLTTANKSGKLLKKSTTNLVELDAPLVPAKISKAELHDKYDMSVSDESGIFSSISSSKHQVVSEVEFPSSPQSFNYSDSSAIKGNSATAQIPRLGANGGKKDDHSDPLMINKGKPFTAQLPLKPKPDVVADDNEESNPSMINSITDHVLPNRAKSCVLTTDSSSTPPLTLNKEQPQTIQDPIKLVGTKAFDGAVCNKGDKLSDENSSLSSGEFHSAEEMQLDDKDKSGVSPQHKIIRFIGLNP